MNNDASEAKPSERKASDKRLWCKLLKLQRAFRSFSEQVSKKCFPCEHVCQLLKIMAPKNGVNFGVDLCAPYPRVMKTNTK